MSISKSIEKQHFYSYLLHDQWGRLYFVGLLKKNRIKGEQEKLLIIIMLIKKLNVLPYYIVGLLCQNPSVFDIMLHSSMWQDR